MKLKHIVAAALVAASAPSFAFLNNNTAGNPELVMVIYDTVDQVSYALDLGLSLDAGLAGATQFNAASAYNYNLGGANFNAFLSAAAVNNNTLQFAVFAGEQVGTSAASRRLFTTVTTGANSAGTQGNFNSAEGNLSGYIGSLVNVSNGSTFGTVDNGDGWASAADTSAAAYFMASNGWNKFNVAALTWTNNNAVGTAATFRSIVNTSGINTGGATTQTDFAGVWSVAQSGSAYTLTYSAVPEADGLALMVAGFGAMGFLARRRKAA